MQKGKGISTISGWLFASYLIIFLASFLGSALCIVTLNSFINLDRKIVKVEVPAIENLRELKSLTKDLNKLSAIYIYQFNWEDKDNLLEIADSLYPELLKRIGQSMPGWENENHRKSFLRADSVALHYLADNKQLIKTLQSIEDYDDDAKVDEAIRILEEKINPGSMALTHILDTILKSKEAQTATTQERKESSFRLLVVVLIMALAVIVATSFIIMRQSRDVILGLIKSVNQIVVKLGEGEIPKKPKKSNLDEINLLNEAINSLVLGTKNKIEFAENIGQGNYDASFEILGQNDVLGKALKKMSENLKESQELILDKNRKITDSINYSQRIQNSLLPTEKTLAPFFSEMFLLFKPRDIVSGDFPYFYQQGGYHYIAIVDCTGHGVPGALMSFVGYFTLNQILHENDHTRSAAAILDVFNVNVQKALKQDSETEGLEDGMDVALCKINAKTLEMEYAGARRPLYLIQAGEFQEVKADKFPIGGINFSMRKPFCNHTFQLAPGDAVVLCTDGLPDQFGGPDGNQKFLSKRVRTLIQTHKNKTMTELKETFDQVLNEWQGPRRQIDDVLVLGFRV